MPLIVAIDGPAGVGKSTAAKALARRLGLPYLDTGAMYRAVALEVLRAGIDPDDLKAVEKFARTVELEVRPRQEPGGGPAEGLEVLVRGEPVGELIRTPEVSSATSKIATCSAVRERLVELQQRAGRAFGGVVEGRDIGTKVFPEARHKFFLEADPLIRAERRFSELRSAGREVDKAEVIAELLQRDERDSNRVDSPLQRAHDALTVNTSSRSVEEVVEEMMAVIGSASQ